MDWVKNLNIAYQFNSVICQNRQLIFFQGGVHGDDGLNLYALNVNLEVAFAISFEDFHHLQPEKNLSNFI